MSIVITDGKTGLCNQIFALVMGIIKHTVATVSHFSVDINSKQRVPANQIFDLETISQRCGKQLTARQCSGPCAFRWYTTHSKFIDILKKIKFADIFYQLAEELLIYDPNQPLHVVHLRVEADALRHWSRVNKMSIPQFQAKLFGVYRDVMKDIPEGEQVLILTSNANHPLIKEFSEKYQIITIDKNILQNKLGFSGREVSAIVDLIAGSKCSGTFVGCHNFSKQRGSSFSFTLWQWSNCKKGVFIDLDEINESLQIHTRL